MLFFIVSLQNLVRILHLQQTSFGLAIFKVLDNHTWLLAIGTGQHRRWTLYGNNNGHSGGISLSPGNSHTMYERH